MEPKLYSDNVDLSDITEHECIIIMKNILERSCNNGRILPPSYAQIKCSNGWLDVFLHCNMLIQKLC